MFELPSKNGHANREQQKAALLEAITGADAVETLKLGVVAIFFGLSRAGVNTSWLSLGG